MDGNRELHLRTLILQIIDEVLHDAFPGVGALERLRKEKAEGFLSAAFIALYNTLQHVG